MKLLKNILFLSALSLSLFSYEKKDDFFKKGHVVDKNQMLKAYNASARYKIRKNFTIDLSGSFILWQPKEQELDIATIIPPQDPTQNHASILQMDFNYDPGFKTALGIGFNKDEWKLLLDYTWFHTTNNVKKDADENTITSQWLDPSSSLNDLTFIKSKWKLFFDMLNLSCGRPYYVGKKLTFQPFVGLKTGWIKQTLLLNYTNAPGGAESFYATKGNQKSWLIGPRIGINTNWLLKDGYKFFTNISAALFHQHFNLSLREYNVETNETNYSANDTENEINASLEIFPGFGWGTNFKKNKCYFECLFGYEFLLFYNQNKLNNFAGKIISNRNSKAGNLTPHGFTFTANLTF